MIMAVNFALVLVVAILRSEYCWTHGTGEVFNMILAFESGDIGPTESAAALKAKEI